MISMSAIHATIVRLVCKLNRREMMGHVKAPAIPDAVATIESRATATVPILSSVRAKRIAVPETVAIASESKNQATRKSSICRSLTATLMVFQSETQANTTYATYDRNLPPLDTAALRVGPGRVRSHMEDGMVNVNHHNPTMNKTKRSGSVDETDAFDMMKRTKMLRIWTKTAAA